MGLVQLNWVDPFVIYDVILIQKGVYRSTGINQLIEQAKAYAAEVKKNPETSHIQLL